MTNDESFSGSWKLLEVGGSNHSIISHFVFLNSRDRILAGNRQ